MPDFSRTIGAIHQRAAGESPVFQGTAFAFRHQRAFLTAAHCVAGVVTSDLTITSPHLGGGAPLQVTSVECHPTADLAVVKVDIASIPPAIPFHILSNNHPPGSDVGAWGYPLDSLPGGGLAPTPRVFKGIVQREMNHQSSFGHQYEAGELSFGAPRGLSGGPVFTFPQQMHLVGVVTENFESTTERQTIEEYHDEHGIIRESTHKVIQYAVYVALKPVARWLETHAGGELGR